MPGEPLDAADDLRKQSRSQLTAAVRSKWLDRLAHAHHDDARVERRWTMKTMMTRRAVLKGGLALGAGLGLGLRIPIGDSAAAPGAGVLAPSQWLTIDRDGIVTIVNSVPEMGQGSLTTMPMIVADELDADLAKVRVEQAPANPALYANPVTGRPPYGHSRRLRAHHPPRRKAAARPRQPALP